MLLVGDDLRSEVGVHSCGFDELHVVNIRCMLLLEAR